MPYVDLGLPLIILALIAVFLVVFVWLIPVKLWIAARVTRTPVGLLDLLGMRLRGTPPQVIVNPLIMAGQAGVPINRLQLEAHYLAGGNVNKVVQALILAAHAEVELSADQACAIDLAGYDVLEAVQTSVESRVIECPNAESGESAIEVAAKDGVPLHARARVTVRTNLERLIGGATEETIVARVGEGIVRAVGLANTHDEVLENTEIISRALLSQGFDSDTACSILAIDVAIVLA